MASITYKLCSRHFQPQKVSRSVGTKIVGKMCSKPRQSVGTRIIGKMRSEHRFVRAARIIKRAICIMIFVTFRGCKKQSHSAF